MPVPRHAPEVGPQEGVEHPAGPVELKASGEARRVPLVQYRERVLAEEDRGRGTTKEWDDMCENFLSFMMNSFQTEVCVVAIRMAALNYQIPFRAAKIPSFTEFTNRYGKEISMAMSA